MSVVRPLNSDLDYVSSSNQQPVRSGQSKIIIQAPHRQQNYLNYKRRPVTNMSTVRVDPYSNQQDNLARIQSNHRTVQKPITRHQSRIYSQHSAKILFQPILQIVKPNKSQVSGIIRSSEATIAPRTLFDFKFQTLDFYNFNQLNKNSVQRYTKPSQIPLKTLQKRKGSDLLQKGCEIQLFGLLRPPTSIIKTKQNSQVINQTEFLTSIESTDLQINNSFSIQEEENQSILPVQIFEKAPKTKILNQESIKRVRQRDFFVPNDEIQITPQHISKMELIMERSQAKGQVKSNERVQVKDQINNRFNNLAQDGISTVAKANSQSYKQIRQIKDQRCTKMKNDNNFNTNYVVVSDQSQEARDPYQLQKQS